ncbi:TonB-dependent receptor [Flavobacterium sp. xlx-214]|uniref:TonB-dependent receptor n=1 Tax=unclassified Flavobacterium TaxID=196869 RepID=UPI0013D75CE2|nr:MULTISPECIES: carboxypeptidase-like regulatory domain-containing protein [unclassified Flavobacterium]MBA5792065.1 TonB-dependent receptor [Flavobacterium sp. xlx-221]QMI84314.1 TonB-dependent receptor [Flavobacterium sp. xlx-214]
MKNRLSTLAMIAFFASTASYAQNKLTGVVYDADKKTAISGVEVFVKGTSEGVTTNEDGSFTISTELTQGQVEFAYLGYTTRTTSFTVTHSTEINLGTIYLSESAESLGEIVVMARGVIDVAEGRKTPIAVSTIKRQEIEEKVGAQDITSTMVNTPSVYVTSQARGFGESSMSTRGFDQSNTAFLLNGQPINGMDNGRVYWSNWSGMTDIANAVQIQRGLGSSKLAISSVGGTINFITKATEMKEGGFFKGTVGNDNFYKTTVGYNTGLLDNGVGVSAMFTHWQGDGYMDQTAGQGQNYFISFGYKVNKKHNLNFLITGAPQWHDQGNTGTIADFLQFGTKYNNNVGLWNGEKYNLRRNYYHKPVANLNWDWQISEKSSLSTVVYASVASGGGRSNNFRVNNIDTTKTQAENDRFFENGLVNIDKYVAVNEADVNGESKNILWSDVNNHQWFGIVSNFNHELAKNLNLNVGFDLRTYKGTHNRQLNNLMGGSYFVDSGNVNFADPIHASNTFGTNPWKSFNDHADNASDKLSWDYEQIIRYAGVFGQLEYSTDRLSAYFQGALSDQSNERNDFYQYTPGNDKSEKVTNIGYNVKAGASYNFENKHFVFANVGVYSRQPYQNNIFMNYRNDINENAENEDIVGLELGYKFTSQFVDVNVNAYQTTWDNRVTGSSRRATADDVKKYNPTNDPSKVQEGQDIYTSNYGTKQNHKGIEIDVVARPLYNLEVKGFASIGDWKYEGNAVSIERDQNRNDLETKITDIDGGKVGDAAQTTFGLGLKYKVLPNLSVDADYRYFQDLYSSRQLKENLMLPSYQVVDAGVSYALNLTNKNRLSFRVNVNNLFDTEYIAQSSTANKVNEKTKGTYKGIDTSNQVLFGWGRTWNASIKLTF